MCQCTLIFGKKGTIVMNGVDDEEDVHVWCQRDTWGVSEPPSVSPSILICSKKLSLKIMYFEIHVFYQIHVLQMFSSTL